MDKGLIRLLEWGKTLLILLLTCSAVYLAMRSQLFGQLLGQTGPEQESYSFNTGWDQVVLPLRLAVMTEGGRYAAQYGSGEIGSVFQRVAPLLNEAISSVSSPLQVTRLEWEQALQAAPGAYFDFQGTFPLGVLSGWLSGRENPQLTANVRRILLCAGESGVVLYYQDEDNENFYACAADVVNLSHLQSAVEDISANGAFFACQSSDYSGLAPYTLISARTPTPMVYAASNPLSGDDGGRLSALLEDLSFFSGITSIYNTPEGRRARSGNDTLSISNDGVITFHSTDGGERYPIPSSEENSPLFAAVEGARQLVQAALEQRCGAAQLYLSSVQTLEPGCWLVEFYYALDGAPVKLSQGGYAARVTVNQRNIVEFELHLRTYTALEETTPLLPVFNAAAAMEQMGRTGGELQLCYEDVSDTAAAGWVVWG